ncbi:MAG: dTMP kinase [Desulfobacteraceae bacterium]|nr:dTMP kinase [Desulfobacteraceae bacterium]
MNAARKAGRPGILIAIEGIDGTGKSTQLRLLAGELVRRGHEVVATREPTDGPFGLKIRELFLNRGQVSPAEELALFVADRREHVRDVIEPALAAGKIVLTDRYYFSTAAYQGAAGHDPEAILRENESFAPEPDLVLLLDLPPAKGIERIESLRGERLNEFEQEQNLRRVAAIFASLRRPCIVRIDAAGDAAAVHGLILAQVERLLAS